jgi:ribosomal protein L3 glutamine methyltransferase
LAEAAPTVEEWVGKAVRRMRRAGLSFGHGAVDAPAEATWMASHVTRIPFERLGMHAARTLRVRERDELERLLDRRCSERMPLAYLLGEAWLAGLRFKVDQRAIVPRSLIAELLPDTVPMLLGQAKPARILDMCTGSGCLAVLLARHWPRSRVDAADLSNDALDLARRNVAMHRLGRRIRLYRSDLFDALPGGRYDMIISNPPYVDGPTMRSLPQEYLHEPSMALAAGKDGLLLTKRILKAARKRLTPDGLLLVETGHHRLALEKAFPTLPFLWLDTAAGDDIVFAIRAADLPA